MTILELKLSKEIKEIKEDLLKQKRKQYYSRGCKYMEMTKAEIEYWNDRKDETFKPVLISDDFKTPTEEEQAETDAEIERIMKEYYS